MSITHSHDGPTPTPHAAGNRWMVHVEVRGDGPAVLAFRSNLETKLDEVPSKRAAVVMMEVGLVSLTFSAFGDNFAMASDDAQLVISSFEVPSSGLTVNMLAPDELERRRSSPFPRLMGVKEVAESLGCSRQWVSELARKDSGDFPRPVSHVQATPIWLGDEVEEWTAAKQRSVSTSRAATLRR